MWVNSNVKNAIKHSLSVKTASKLQFKNILIGKLFKFILNYYFNKNNIFQSDLNISKNRLTTKSVED
jgi:hypothetical protein